LLFGEDVVKTFCGETVRKLRALSSVAVGILVWTLVFAGCSGSNSLTVTLSPASGQTLNPGATVTITAAVANDKNNQGVTWTLTGPGSLSGNTTTSVVYTAPSNVSVSTTATVTATSVTNSSVTATESITLNAVLTITTTSLPAGSLGVGYSAFVNAAGATGTFTWTITAGSLPAGLSFQTTTTSSSASISGTPTLLGTSKFSVQVTDSAGTSVTQAMSITINPPPPLSVATGSLPNGMVNQAYPNQTLQASSGVQPYSWSVTSGNLPFGLSLATNGVISGTPIATGNFSFTVQVKDSSTPNPQTASANLSITINLGNTNNSRLNGSYVFSVSGSDPSLLFVAAGSFTADGAGHISGGIMDINDTSGVPANETFSGAYSIGQNGLGYMTFNITAGGTGSRAFAFSMTAKGDANNLIEFDDNTGGGTRNSGVLLRETTSPFSTSLINNNYAFGFLGIDSSKNRFGVAGDFQADGAGHFTNGLLDSNDAGSLSSAVAFGGAYGVASNGRGTATIATANYSFYIANSGELLVVGIDPFTPGGNPLVSGTILPQTGGSDFTGGSVFELTALNASTAESQVGQFQAVTGNFNLASDQNTGGTLTQPSGSGSYSITNDRVTLSPNPTTGSGFQNTTPTSSQPVFYMVSGNEAFIIGTDTAVSFGFMAPQQLGSSLAGIYAGGSLAPVDPAVSNAVSVSIAGSNTLIVTSDISSSNGLSVLNQVSEATTPPDTHGRVLVTLLGSDVDILYLVSPSEFFQLSAVPADADVRVDIFQQ
jgi:hypothetical protein